MADQERYSYATLIGVALVAVVFFGSLYLIWQSGSFHDPAAGSLAGKMSLALMFACVVANSVARAITGKLCGGSADPFAMDERDQMIELRGLQASYLTFTIGFVATMIWLWAGLLVPLAIIMIVGSLLVGSLVHHVVKIVLYRASA